MRNYLDLMTKCRDEGIDIFNARTNIVCRTLIGAQVEFDLSSGLFPAVTTKKLAFKAVKGELLGFFRGYTSAADFRALGCNVWNQNANETQAWLDNPFRKGEDDLGPIYGKQWTEWDNYYELIGSENPLIKTLEDKGYSKIGDNINNDPIYKTKVSDVLIYKKTINQLEVALRTIITNPSDRRIIVTGWNPGDIDKVALPACHMDYRFIPVNGVLNVIMTIR